MASGSSQSGPTPNGNQHDSHRRVCDAILRESGQSGPNLGPVASLFTYRWMMRTASVWTSSVGLIDPSTCCRTRDRQESPIREWRPDGKTAT